MGHRTNKVKLIITLSSFLTILMFIYVVYIKISCAAISQRRRIHLQRSRSQININGSIQSSKIVKSSNQGRAGIFVLILLTVLTLTWTLFIVLHIYDFQVHRNNDENIMWKLKKYNCSGEDSLQTAFPKLRYQYL
mgnify:FL=1